MSKKLFAALLAAALAFPAAGLCDSLYVDNHEEDLSDPERVNLREEPSTNSVILGLYYTGTEVENLGAVNDAFTRVRVGGLTGYMVSQYLSTWEDAVARCGEDGAFGQCRAAQVDLTGMWQEEQPLYESADAQSPVLAALRSGQRVRLKGIVDDWAYVSADGEQGAEHTGYVPICTLTDVGNGKISVVAGAKSGGEVTLYDLPNDNGVEVVRIKNGASCFSLFGRGEGNWRRVRVGGIAGWVKYTQAGELVPIGEISRSAVPYYPQVMRAGEGALLMSRAGDAAAPYVTLGGGTQVEVLGERGEYAYVRTVEGGPGAGESGQFGYVAMGMLTPQAANMGTGIAQIDDGDLPVLLLAAPDEDAARIGALCAGAQVRIADYTQTDYVLVAMGEATGYVNKAKIRVLGGTGVRESERIPQRAKTRRALTLRAGTDERSAQTGRVPEGERVYMLGLVGEWAYVRYASAPGLTEDCVSGFVRLEDLTAPASTTHLTASVNTDKVNMRDREDKSGEIVARARLGDCLRVANYGNDWCCVVTPDGKRGYIMTEYLEFG